jgi:hypothetical protein
MSIPGFGVYQANHAEKLASLTRELFSGGAYKRHQIAQNGAFIQDSLTPVSEPIEIGSNPP